MWLCFGGLMVKSDVCDLFWYVDVVFALVVVVVLMVLVMLQFDLGLVFVFVALLIGVIVMLGVSACWVVGLVVVGVIGVGVGLMIDVFDIY